MVRLCASHLLYPARCSARVVAVTAGDWQERQVSFPSWIFSRMGGVTRTGHGVFLISVLTPKTSFEIDELRLDADGRNLLGNPRFHRDKGLWFPQSFHYFQPWHMDNLYLELLVETGILGLAGFLCLVWNVLRRSWRACSTGETFANEVLSCALGVGILGAVVSILDMPRVAWLAGTVLILGWRYGQWVAQRPRE